MRLGVFFEIFVHKKTKKRHPVGWRNMQKITKLPETNITAARLCSYTSS